MIWYAQRVLRLHGREKYLSTSNELITGDVKVRTPISIEDLHGAAVVNRRCSGKLHQLSKATGKIDTGAE
jgi:hypothetical protein